MDEIRKNLGMCPQHNILFDKLTVEEHLWLYSQLKSMAEDEIRKEVDKWVPRLCGRVGGAGLEQAGWCWPSVATPGSGSAGASCPRTPWPASDGPPVPPQDD